MEKRLVWAGLAVLCFVILRDLQVAVAYSIVGASVASTLWTNSIMAAVVGALVVLLTMRNWTRHARTIILGAIWSGAIGFAAFLLLNLDSLRALPQSTLTMAATNAGMWAALGAASLGASAYLTKRLSGD